MESGTDGRGSNEAGMNESISLYVIWDAAFSAMRDTKSYFQTSDKQLSSKQMHTAIQHVHDIGQNIQYLAAADRGKAILLFLIRSRESPP